MEYGLTEKMFFAKDSIIRGIAEIAAKDLKPGEKVISFAAGWPDPDALPDDQMSYYSEKVLKEHGKEILQYGSYIGYEFYRQEIVKFLNKDGVICSDDDNIVITYGSGQGLHLIGDAFVNRGDMVLVEDPSYLNATNLFKMLGANIVGVPVEDDGVNIEALEKVMNVEPRPKFFYTIPSFGNPSAITMSQEKRKKVYELAVKYQVVIFEDNPYGYLRFKGENIMPIKSLDREGAVIYAGTMSKIVAPGMRSGFLCCDKKLCERLQALKDNVTATNVNWCQYTIGEFLHNTDMNEHIRRITSIYEKKASLMYRKMKECFHPSVKFAEPYGGMFIWVALPEGVLSTPFCMEAAKKLHIAIVPGEEFSINQPEKCTSMRFNYSAPSEEDIVEGIERIGKLTYEYCER
jgi:Transcriptional regulators containing a DNA-binding HTH domain and an aminotransferase domain (MocR family) and their eukaryotic orthologs